MNKESTNSSSRNKPSRTHYETLGVEENADFTTIKNAHRKLALRFHPDKLVAKKNRSITDCDPNIDPVAPDAPVAPVEENSSTANYYDSKNINNDDEMFKKIQTAWECLSDDKKRREYDDTLGRMRERSHGNLIKAQNVTLSEMTVEICDVEDSDNDDDNVNTNISKEEGNKEYRGDCNEEEQSQTLYSFTCRCGDTFEMLEEELNFDHGAQSKNIFQCESCSLLINVIP